MLMLYGGLLCRYDENIPGRISDWYVSQSYNELSNTLTSSYLLLLLCQLNHPSDSTPIINSDEREGGRTLLAFEEDDDGGLSFQQQAA